MNPNNQAAAQASHQPQMAANLAMAGGSGLADLDDTGDMEAQAEKVLAEAGKASIES
jgi:hypothetical protein